MDSKRRVHLIIFAILIIAVLGIAIPRFVSKPKGERFKVKEISPGRASTQTGSNSFEPSRPGARPGAGGEGDTESDHHLGRNPFRELIRPSVTGTVSLDGGSASPFGGDLGAGPLWPGGDTTVEPFSPGSLPGIGDFGIDGSGGSPYPAYTLTGVVSGDSSVAVLRTADSREYVRPGDVLDDGSRVASVYRDRVVLNRSDGQVVLVLGGSNNDGSIEQDAGYD